MDSGPLDVWCNRSFDDASHAELLRGLGPHRLSLAHAGAAGGSGLAEADVAFGQPPVGPALASPRLRWVHLTSAGYTAFDEPATGAGFSAGGKALTTSSAVYAEPCAQHVLALMLAEARKLPLAMRHMLGDRAWAREISRSTARLVGPKTVVLLVGYGSIGARLRELLAPLGPEVIGVRRRPRGDEPLPVFPISALDGLLPRADHVVDLLPANGETQHLFDAARFARMKPGALFYNIGRGSTVVQADLAAALQSGRLGGALLDVTDPEPLPPGHPFWGAPNLVVTPHAAGGHAGEDAHLVSHFLENLRRFERGAPLLDRVF